MTVPEPILETDDDTPDLVARFRFAMPHQAWLRLALPPHELCALIWQAAGHGWEPKALAGYVTNNIHHYYVTTTGAHDLMVWRLRRAAHGTDDTNDETTGE